MTAEGHRESIDNLDALLEALPREIVDAVHALPEKEALIEVVLDLGRRPEARFPDSEVTLLEREISELDIAHVVEHIGAIPQPQRPSSCPPRDPHPQHRVLGEIAAGTGRVEHGLEGRAGQAQLLPEVVDGEAPVRQQP